MASKRRLKKNFTNLSLAIYNEAIWSLVLNKDEDKKENINGIIDDIIVWTDDTIRRISHTDANKNPKLVKKYYKELIEDINEKADNFLDKIFE